MLRRLAPRDVVGLLEAPVTVHPPVRQDTLELLHSQLVVVHVLLVHLDGCTHTEWTNKNLGGELTLLHTAVSDQDIMKAAFQKVRSLGSMVTRMHPAIAGLTG